MIINEKEINFKHTVTAECAIYKWCPEAAVGIKALNEALNDAPPAERLLNRGQFIISMYMGWKDKKKYCEKIDVPELELGEVMSLNPQIFIEAYTEALKAFNNEEDSKPTVETEPQKKRRKRETR